MDETTRDEPLHVFVRHADGTETDVTEGVQVLYDTVIASMDWGSGFLTVEDAEPIVAVAIACQFNGWEAAQKYVDAQRASLEQVKLQRRRNLELQRRREWNLTGTDLSDIPAHEHVFSVSTGKCMWSGCGVGEEDKRK